MPLPAARILSASVPCGHSSTAILPARYCRSSVLLVPRYDMMMRSTWPFSVRRARPPRPSTPALLDTAVSEWRDSGPRRRNAAISVAAAARARRVEPDRQRQPAVVADRVRALTRDAAQPEARAQHDRAALDVGDRLVGAAPQLRTAAADLRGFCEPQPSGLRKAPAAGEAWPGGPRRRPRRRRCRTGCGSPPQQGSCLSRKHRRRRAHRARYAGHLVV